MKQYICYIPTLITDETNPTRRYKAMREILPAETLYSKLLLTRCCRDKKDLTRLMCCMNIIRAKLIKQAAYINNHYRFEIKQKKISPITIVQNMNSVLNTFDGKFPHFEISKASLLNLVNSPDETIEVNANAYLTCLEYLNTHYRNSRYMEILADINDISEDSDDEEYETVWNLIMTGDIEHDPQIAVLVNSYIEAMFKELKEEKKRIQRVPEDLKYFMTWLANK